MFNSIKQVKTYLSRAQHDRWALCWWKQDENTKHFGEYTKARIQQTNSKSENLVTGVKHWKC